MLDGQLLAFMGVALVISLTPGPDMALVLRNSIRGGRAAAYRTILGTGVGLIGWATASAEAGDVDRGLALVERLELDQYHYLPAVRAELLRRLGRVGEARAAIQEQLRAFKKLDKTIDGTRSGAASALRAFEPLFFNNMVLVLDRPFVHRLRKVTAKDANALNEVELLADSLMNNNGVLRGNNVITYAPEQSILKLQIGDPIELTAADFARLSTAFFDELERKFL